MLTPLPCPGLRRQWQLATQTGLLHPTKGGFPGTAWDCTASSHRASSRWVLVPKGDGAVPLRLHLPWSQDAPWLASPLPHPTTRPTAMVNTSPDRNQQGHTHRYSAKPPKQQPGVGVPQVSVTREEIKCSQGPQGGCGCQTGIRDPNRLPCPNLHLVLSSLYPGLESKVKLPLTKPKLTTQL